GGILLARKGPSGRFLALNRGECQQGSKTLAEQWLTAERPDPNRPAGAFARRRLLAGSQGCCYRLDFKQFVYLFGLQCLVLGLETCVRLAKGDAMVSQGFVSEDFRKQVNGFG